MAAGNGFTCGALSGGATYCWGGNAAGQLGDGSTTVRLTPVASGGVLTFASLTTGGGHSCGVTNSGAACCWGYDIYGQLGDSSLLGQRNTPMAVADGRTFVLLTAGWAHTCGVTTDRTAYCWGDNASGELGDGLAINHLTPVAVANP